MNTAKSTYQEVREHDKCPCGSNRKYKNCCKKKDIIWYLENGRLFREVMIESEVIEELKSLKLLFKSMYGREVGEDDYVFWGIYDDETIFDKDTIRVMKKAGIQEEYIYAYSKTGLIITEENNNNIPDGYLKEFSNYVAEYKSFINETPVSNNVNILLFVKFANYFLSEIYNKILISLNYSFNYFIRVHLEKDQDFLNYNVTSKLDYGGLCAIKTLKNLGSIKKLNDNDFEENIYATSRFIFESYLYMTMLNTEQTFFQECILRPKKIFIINLAERSVYAQDKNLYDLFFKGSSKYVHLDILTAQSYFKVSNPFEEINGSLIASIMGITFAVLTLEQIAMFPECQKQFQKDILYMIENSKQDLIKCYEIISSESSANNEVYSALILRLKEI